QLLQLPRIDRLYHVFIEARFFGKLSVGFLSVSADGDELYLCVRGSGEDGVRPRSRRSRAVRDRAGRRPVEKQERFRAPPYQNTLPERRLLIAAVAWQRYRPCPHCRPRPARASRERLARRSWRNPLGADLSEAGPRADAP